MQCCLHLQTTGLTQACVNLIFLLLRQLLKSNDFHISLKGSEIYFALGKKLIVTVAHRQGRKDHTVLQHWTLRAVLSPVAALLLLLLEPHCLTGNGRFHSLRNVPGHLFPFLPLHLQTSGKKGTRWNLNFRAKIALP